MSAEENTHMADANVDMTEACELSLSQLSVELDNFNERNHLGRALTIATHTRLPIMH
jgi:hypothetical protein